MVESRRSTMRICRTPSSGSETVGYGRHLTHGRRPVNRRRPRCRATVPALAVMGLAVLALIVGVLRPRRVAVEGPSMEPTLRSGDRLLLLRRSSPRLGDIVAVADPRSGRRLLLKRVVSVAGDELAVEGDNPSRSTDSRVFGPVHRRDVRGRVVYRYFPPGRAGLLP